MDEKAAAIVRLPPYNFTVKIYEKSKDGITRVAMTSTPSAILYQPNTLKSCFFTKSIKNLIAHKETAKATAPPMSKYPISAPDIVPVSKKNFKSLYALAPTMVGIAKMKVKFDAVVLFTPKSNAPMMVMPERDVPGIAANSWKQPMKKAYL